MSILYGYNDMIWKPEYTFSYTGDPQEFTLDPGKYFIMCSGARGGGSLMITIGHTVVYQWEYLNYHRNKQCSHMLVGMEL